MPRTPTVGRCLLVLCGLLLPIGAVAQPAPVALTEREAVARALARAPLAETLEGAVAIEEGRGQAASAAPTPQLAARREQTFGALGSSEHSVSVVQLVDLGRRRGLHGKAGAARTRAARREGEGARAEVAAEVRLRFYEVLYRQGRVAALESWLARIDDALVIVGRREQRGDAAAYDRRRLERERAVATGRLDTERATALRASARLAALLGDGAQVRVTGALLPDADPPELSALRAQSATRPELLALDLRLAAASHERTAASRWWLPELVLEGGWKGVDLGDQGRSDGYLLGASLALPLWNQAAGLARAAEGEARVARGRRELLERELAAELEGARLEAVGLRRAAATLREQTGAASADLVRIAAAGYGGGELGLLELLDAYRGAAEDSLSALELEHAARRARVELDRLTGAGLP